MVYPVLVLLALLGACLLGFGFAFILQRNKRVPVEHKNVLLAADLKDERDIIQRLTAEKETLELSLANLQKVFQDVENQLFTLERELAAANQNYEKLSQEHEYLKANPVEREIEVIREVPVLVFRELKLPETRDQKAERLVKAFKKGLTIEAIPTKTMAE